MYGSKRGGWRNRPIRYCALPLPTQWSKQGAHDLLQARVRVLNDELRDKFEHWYPGFGGHDSEELKLAA